MNLTESCEIVLGLTLNGYKVIDSVSGLLLPTPYDKALKIVTSGGDITEVMNKVGLEPVRIAQEAAAQVLSSPNPLAVDWGRLLREASADEYLARELEMATKSIRRGTKPNFAQLVGLIKDQSTLTATYVTMDQVDPSTGIWVPSYYAPIDLHLGGVIKAGLVIIAAPPGSGKTSLFIQMAAGAARQGKKVLIYTFEMTLGQITMRCLEISGLEKKYQKNITLTDKVMTVYQVAQDAARIVDEDYAFIGVDFADLMSTQEDTEQAVGMIYRTLATLAKETGVPVVLMSQLNRNYAGGLPRIHHIRWSGLAEAMASLILLLYNPNQVWADHGDDKRLPDVPGRGYLIVGKSRFGYKEGTVGAIQVDWNGAEAWGTDSYGWFPLTGGV